MARVRKINAQTAASAEVSAHQKRAPATPTQPPLTLPPGPYAEPGADPIRLTEAGLTVVELVAREGGKQRGVAAALGVTFKQFRSLIDRDEPVRLRWERGVAGLEAEVAGLLLAAARAGGVVPAIYFSKAVLGWTENSPPAAVANITITAPVSLPAPLSIEDYARRHAPPALASPAVDAEFAEFTEINTSTTEKTDVIE
jgi:hypothetical protein